MKRLFAFGLSVLMLVEPDSAAKPGGPTKLGPPIPYYSGNEYLSGQRRLYAADLNCDGVDEVVFSGHIRWGSKLRSADAVVGGRRNFLGNVVNVNGTLYFYSGGQVATSTNSKRFRLKHNKGLPGDPGIAYLDNKWYGIEAH